MWGRHALDLVTAHQAAWSSTDSLKRGAWPRSLLSRAGRRLCIWQALRAGDARSGREVRLARGEVFRIRDGAPDPCGDPSVLGRTGAEPRTTNAAGWRLGGLCAERQVLQNRRQEAEEVASDGAVWGAGLVLYSRGMGGALQSPHGSHQAAPSTPARGHPPGEKVTWGL